MLNKQNVLGIIDDHKKKIDDLKKDLSEVDELGKKLSEASRKKVKNAFRNEIAYLEDNKARYELQARAWELID